MTNEDLTKRIPEGSEIYTLREDSASNLTHWVRLFFVDKETMRLWEISGDRKGFPPFVQNRTRRGYCYGGGGTDFGYDAVDDLSRALHGKGYAFGHSLI